MATFGVHRRATSAQENIWKEYGAGAASPSDQELSFRAAPRSNPIRGQGDEPYLDIFNALGRDYCTMPRETYSSHRRSLAGRSSHTFSQGRHSHSAFPSEQRDVLEKSFQVADRLLKSLSQGHDTSSNSGEASLPSTSMNSCATSRQGSPLVVPKEQAVMFQNRSMTPKLLGSDWVENAFRAGSQQLEDYDSPSPTLRHQSSFVAREESQDWKELESQVRKASIPRVPTNSPVAAPSTLSVEKDFCKLVEQLEQYCDEVEARIGEGSASQSLPHSGNNRAFELLKRSCATLSKSTDIARTNENHLCDKGMAAIKRWQGKENKMRFPSAVQGLATEYLKEKVLSPLDVDSISPKAAKIAACLSAPFNPDLALQIIEQIPPGKMRNEASRILRRNVALTDRARIDVALVILGKYCIAKDEFEKLELVAAHIKNLTAKSSLWMYAIDQCLAKNNLGHARRMVYGNQALSPQDKEKALKLTDTRFFSKQ